MVPIHGSKAGDKNGTKNIKVTLQESVGHGQDSIDGLDLAPVLLVHSLKPCKQ
jgi:hypothetical protein